ncbi:MAG: protein-tyrosine-phosphatase [Flavobacteriales bacterium]|nr:protein-tyrosine-phosphatase [Flavobacteriales bacterium]
MFEKVKKVVDCIDFDTISDSRIVILHELIDYVNKKIDEDFPIGLNFICTHNSRRSQFSQLWAKVASDFYGLQVACFSGGVEVTSFNERAVASIRRFGFEVEVEGMNNPLYLVRWKEDQASFPMYSKLYDDKTNPASGFGAIMTCSHADENCPVVEGCEKRLPLRYEDPKKYDNTPLESVMYDCRSFEIATEMFYVFSKIKKS